MMFVEGCVVGGIVGVVPVLVIGFESARGAAVFFVCTVVCFGLIAAVAGPSALAKLTAYVLTFFNP